MYVEKERAGSSAVASAPQRTSGVQGELAPEAEPRGGEAATCSPTPQSLGRDLSLTQPGRHELSGCSAAPTPAFGFPGCGAEHKSSPPVGKHGTEPISPGSTPRDWSQGLFARAGGSTAPTAGSTGRSSWINHHTGKGIPIPHISTLGGVGGRYVQQQWGMHPR